MSNEMPEKIFVTHGLVEGSLIIPRHGGQPCVEYTRTDTIPSKAEVAQEFMDEVSLRVDDTGMRFEGAADEVLKEWEDAETK